jgi:sortase A
MGVNMLLVNGTDHNTLKKGPGRDLRTFMPGENRLVYIAGHRTTYLAPFSHIDRLRSDDRVTIEVPYGTFIYTVTKHRIVKSTDLSVLRSPRYELVELQACHPRFFASHRYIVYARLLRVEPRGAKPYDVTAQASSK